MREKKSNKYTLLAFIASGMILVLAFLFYQYQSDQAEREAVSDSLNKIAKENPALSLPADYDLEKSKHWDSGIEEYELKSSAKDYIVHVRDSEAVAIYLKKGKQQIYPVVPKDKEQTVSKEEPAVEEANNEKDVANPSAPAGSEAPINNVPVQVSQIPAPQVAQGEPMGKWEYTITITKLLGEALINVEDVQVLVDSPELEINADTIDTASRLLNESVALFNEALKIVPPVDWQGFHQDLLTMWHTHIMGEQGLVNSMQEAWHASADERAKAWEVVKEKSVLAGEYSLEFGELLIRFLGELTGLAS